jgi:glycosyltransferase involved in cell wall biosynthesis
MLVEEMVIFSLLTVNIAPFRRGMNRSEKLIFAVTNDLNYDQRMIRICSSLSRAGYHVTLVGRRLPASIPLAVMPYHQFRIKCFFHKGFIFYAEFNIRLFFYLLYKKANLICAIDLDTIIPCFIISILKNIPRVYDAHELFCEMKEVVTRPRIYRCWKRIEKFMLPRFKHGYTVNDLISGEFSNLYGVSYASVRNVPYRSDHKNPEQRDKNMVLYQGAVNEGRCFETLIPAFKSLNAMLVICGDGNFMDQARQIVKNHCLDDKIHFKGWVSPDILKTYTLRAYVGVNIIENTGLNNTLSLSNRFFDYIQSGLPQVCVNYPAYRQINDEFNCAYLIEETSTHAIVNAIQTLLNNDDLYNTIRVNCMKAANVFNWTVEEQKLLSFYQNIFERA